MTPAGSRFCSDKLCQVGEDWSSCSLQRVVAATATTVGEKDQKNDKKMFRNVLSGEVW